MNLQPGNDVASEQLMAPSIIASSVCSGCLLPSLPSVFACCLVLMWFVYLALLTGTFFAIEVVRVCVRRRASFKYYGKVCGAMFVLKYQLTNRLSDLRGYGREFRSGPVAGTETCGQRCQRYDCRAPQGSSPANCKGARG